MSKNVSGTKKIFYRHVASKFDLRNSGKSLHHYVTVIHSEMIEFAW